MTSQGNPSSGSSSADPKLGIPLESGAMTEREHRVLTALWGFRDKAARTHHIASKLGMMTAEVRRAMLGLERLKLVVRVDRYSAVNDVMWQAKDPTQ